MVFGPFEDVWEWLKSHNPGWPFKKRRLSFITYHYIYLISLSLIGSILIYPAGGLAYIDALLFASGCATQSGLNTIDVNTLNTYQQVVIYLIPMISNPIFINTFVVFLRLFWFEKRFQHIVREATSVRRSRTMSRRNTQALEEKDNGNEERGVNGRNIVVLHDSPFGPSKDPPFQERPKPHNRLQDTPEPQEAQKDSSTSSEQDHEMPALESSEQRPPFFTRDIMFADEVDRGPKTVLEDNDSTNERPMPKQMSSEQHIAFLENQRNPKDKDALHIPGPREFDRGDIPTKSVHHDNEGQLSRLSSGSEDKGNDRDIEPDRDVGDGAAIPPIKRNITIDDSNAIHARRNQQSSAFSKLTLRRTGTDRSKEAPTFDRHGSTGRPESRSSTFPRLRTSATKESHPMPYLSWQPTIGRNSAFVDLTEDQREELGGIEYRSLKTLAIVLVSYFLFFHIIGVVIFVPWIVQTNEWGSVVDADGQSRVWWGIFSPATCFNDLGFTLTPDSFISFQEAVVPLLIGSFLIIIGNTGFPCMLRLIIWILTKLVPMGSGLWEEFKFLLDHPRRCFTLLFPSDATWWLFWILFLLNGIDVVFFIILDLGDPTVTSINPPGFRFLDGLFQAASTRTSGTAVVDIADLHPGIQVSYLVMMYISVFPIAISVRRTNVYEEKSLGIYGSTTNDEEDSGEPSYVAAHLRRQLSFDLWFIFMGLFIIAVAEGSRLQDPNDTAFSLFACLFEIVSAYGTVGLSLGYPNINAAFSAEFGIVAKLVIATMQIRGRHRGLPYDLDRAILLPSESMHSKEDEDAARRVQRRRSSASMAGDRGAGLRTFATNTTGISRRGIEPAEGLVGETAENKLETKDSHHMSLPHAKGGLGKFMASLASSSDAVTGAMKRHE